VPLGDGDPKDGPESLCAHVVPEHGPAAERGAPPRNARAYPEEAWPGLLPKCMELITPGQVIDRIEVHFKGGLLHHLADGERELCEAKIPGWGRRRGRYAAGVRG
jgi:hypothetical protein